MKMTTSLLGFSLVSMLAQPCLAQNDKPNIIIIYADDLGYGDIGCYGADPNIIQTPRIDSLATDGRKFTDGHSPSAVCTPSRYSFLTGIYPFRDNIYTPIFLRNRLIIPEDTTTLADVFQQDGYSTGIIGKWHLGFQNSNPVDWNAELKPGPLELGFDYYYGVPVVNSNPPFVYVENHHVVGHVYDPNSPDYDPFDYSQGAGSQGYTQHPIHEKNKVDDIGGAQAAHALYRDYEVGLHLADKTIEWIDQNKDDPFFLILSTTHIHHPFTPAPQFQGTSGAGLYGDFLHELDHIVGMILDKLEAEGLDDNTIVIFTADNGGMGNETARTDAFANGHSINGDLLGFKSDGWEGGHRVPFIVKWPNKVPAGTVSDQLISAVDFIPTLAALSDIDVSGIEIIDGVDMSEAFTGNPTSQIRDHLIATPLRSNLLTIRQGDWAYLSGQGSGGWNGGVTSHTMSGPRSTNFTGDINSDIINGSVSASAPPAQLYDLSNDLSQTTNLYNSESAKVSELSSLLESIVNLEHLRAEIQWSVSPISTSELDVNNAGDTVIAINNSSNSFAAMNPTILVNDVEFTSSGDDLSSDFSGDGWTPSDVDANYDLLLSSVDFKNSGTDFENVITFENLKVGRPYLVQVWYAASAQPRTMTLDSFDSDGSGNPVLNGLTYATGTFIARYNTQSIAMAASSSGPRLTAYQLRDLGAIYDTWIANQPIPTTTDKDADEDQDNIPNVMEFVLNGDPNSHDTIILPQVTLESDGSRTYHFVRRIDSTLATSQVIEYSSDLESWSELAESEIPNDISVNPVSNNPELEEVSVNLHNLELEGKVFLRLRVN
ncbi:arylsulfatase [Rubritalea spongiae]|uniref:Arylsulfatase n=1 Tax=Rubritalea spongiae TaxID=430797 RepID=A0ABW5DYB4_9BACT